VSASTATAPEAVLERLRDDELKPYFFSVSLEVAGDVEEEVGLACRAGQHVALDADLAA
jgi:hypothetical protein